MILRLCLAAAAGYLLGSLSGSIIISKTVYKKDIRTAGSGNAGMTNTLRTFGTGAATATAAIDILKTVAAVLLGRVLCGIDGILAAGIAAVLGHAFPAFFRLKGGKSVICTAVVGCFIDYRMVLCALAVFGCVLVFSGFMSLASVSAMAAAPVAGLCFGLRGLPLVAVVLMCAFVIFMHRSNLQRLRHGTEKRIISKGGKAG